MITINEHFLKLQSSYLFSTISKKVSAFQKENPDKEIIKLGIGDVTRALPDACIRLQIVGRNMKSLGIVYPPVRFLI